MRRISRCLNTKILEICQQAILLEELNAKINEYLPESLRNQCQVGSFTKGCLVLITKDAGWASQLRYSVPELRDKLRCEAGIYQLSSIKVTVAAEQPPAPVKKVSAKTISATACDEIITQANACSYQPLKQALNKLAGYKPKSGE